MNISNLGEIKVDGTNICHHSSRKLVSWLFRAGSVRGAYSLSNSRLAIPDLRLTPLEDVGLEGLCIVGELAVAQGLPTDEEMAVIEGLTPPEDVVLQGLCITGELALAQGLPMGE